MTALATCSYSEYVPTMGVPVRSSRGTPKWFRYELRLAWDNIMPDGWMLGIEDRDKFSRVYCSKLDKIGYARLKQDVEFLAEAWENYTGEPAHTLVILCFENISKPGKWCHRTIFTEWWEQQSGDTVAEFGALPEIAEPNLDIPLF